MLNVSDKLHKSNYVIVEIIAKEMNPHTKAESMQADFRSQHCAHNVWPRI